MKLLRALLWLLLSMLAGALLWQVIASDPGLVIVRFRGYDISTSVPVAGLFLVLAGLAIWLLVSIIRIPFRVWSRYRQRRARARRVVLQLRGRVGERGRRFGARLVEQPRPLVVCDAAHVVHLPVHLGACRGGLALELVGGRLRLERRAFRERARRVDRLLPFLHRVGQRLEEQPVDRERQDEDEEDDPEERKIQFHKPKIYITGGRPLCLFSQDFRLTQAPHAARRPPPRRGR